MRHQEPVADEASVIPPEHSRRSLISWWLYDFANSPFSALVVTFIYATYFTQVIAANPVIGTTYWSRAVTITAIVVAISSPILGTLADRGGYRKFFLAFLTLVCVGATCGLFTILPGQVLPALTWFVVANVAYELASVFYNAFLPDIAPPGHVGRVSGYGWALGYVGGLIALLIALFGFVQPEVPWFGISKVDDENIRATNLVVAAWFLVFSLPLFVWVKSKERPTPSRAGGLVRGTFRQLSETFHEVKRYRQIVRFLVARLIYNDALITVFAFGGIYAAGTFGFTTKEILIFGIVLNITAGAGAFGMAILDDRWGGKRTVLLSLWGLAFATLLAIVAPNRTVFWVAGIMIGIFAGPNQSASRSLMARFIPPARENEFFGFFAFSGKATAFIGPFVLGVLTEVFDSQRAGICIVLLLFAAGYFALRGVDEDEGIRAAAR